MNIRKNGVLYLTMMLGGVILCCLVYDNLVHLDTRINSDFAAQIVLADIIKDTHQILPAEWNFSTEIHLSFATLFSAVLLNIFSDWTTCYMISNILTYILLAICVLKVCRALEIKDLWAIGIVIGILAPVSEGILYYFHVGNEYMTYAIYQIIFVILWLRIKEKPHIDMSLALYAVWSLFLGMMGFRYVMTCFAPVALIEVYAFCKGDKKSINMAALFGVGVGGIGILLNRYILSGIYTVKEHTNRYFKDISDIPERITRSLKSVIALFGYVQNGRLLSWQGMINILSLFLFVICICALVYCIRRSGTLPVRMKDYTYLVLSGVVVDAFIVIFTCEDENPLNDIVGKYFILSIILFGPLIARYISDRKRNTGILQVVVLCVYLVLSSSYAVTRDISGGKKKDSIDCIDHLKEEGVLYGYSTFWQGNINQFYSDGQIVISPTGNFETFDLLRHISSTRQYEAVQDQEKYFIWLTMEENESWKERITNVVKSYSNDRYMIYICER